VPLDVVVIAAINLLVLGMLPIGSVSIFIIFFLINWMI
jgi:hypothetical protein